MDAKVYLNSDSRSRPKLHAFHPPGDNPICHGLLRLLLPLSLRVQLGYPLRWRTPYRLWKFNIRFGKLRTHEIDVVDDKG